MGYALQYRPAALKDLKSMSKDAAARILDKIEMMRDDLAGDVKRLRHFTPKYRLRVGDWRVLFEIEADEIIVWRVRHRSEVYDR
jgi:mRNA interferase RelE/StbE